MLNPRFRCSFGLLEGLSNEFTVDIKSVIIIFLCFFAGSSIDPSSWYCNSSMYALMSCILIILFIISLSRKSFLTSQPLYIAKSSFFDLFNFILNIDFLMKDCKITILSVWSSYSCIILLAWLICDWFNEACWISDCLWLDSDALSCFINTELLNISLFISDCSLRSRTKLRKLSYVFRFPRAQKHRHEHQNYYQMLHLQN